VARSGSRSAPGPRASKASADTRSTLISAAIETLKADGFVGASARAIAGRAGCNQGLVFYHFGSVANLLLAALDAVSSDRLERYGAAAAQAESPSELANLAEVIFQEDLDAGHATVLVELISGASSMPGFGAEVATRIESWTRFAQSAIDRSIDPKVLAATAPASELAYGVVAMYLGLEMLSHLNGDRTQALSLFRRASRLITWADALGVLSPAPTKEPT
jgi:AcrR family transcriptional regulator